MRTLHENEYRSAALLMAMWHSIQSILPIYLAKFPDIVPVFTTNHTVVDNLTCPIISSKRSLKNIHVYNLNIMPIAHHRDCINLYPYVARQQISSQMHIQF